MAEIEIGPLTDRLSDDEITELARKMEKLGAPQLPRTDESHAGTITDELDEDALAEFLDRLDAHDVAADVYLPVEFEGIIEIADLRIGSAPTLLDALDEVKEELAADEDEEDEDDEDDDDRAASEAEQREVLKAFLDGAAACVDKKLPLHVKQ